jgi:hypothetical protein
VADADLIVPGRDKAWTVEVTKTWTAYVVAETPEQAGALAGEADEDPCAEIQTWVRPLTQPVKGADGHSIAWGHSLHGDRQLVVNEVVALLAGEVGRG